MGACREPQSRQRSQVRRGWERRTGSVAVSVCANLDQEAVACMQSQPLVRIEHLRRAQWPRSAAVARSQEVDGWRRRSVSVADLPGHMPSHVRLPALPSHLLCLQHAALSKPRTVEVGLAEGDKAALLAGVAPLQALSKIDCGPRALGVS